MMGCNNYKAANTEDDCNKTTSKIFLLTSLCQYAWKINQKKNYSKILSKFYLNKRNNNPLKRFIS